MTEGWLCDWCEGEAAVQERMDSFKVSMPPRRLTYSLQSQQRWLADEVQALIQVCCTPSAARPAGGLMRHVLGFPGCQLQHARSGTQRPR